MMVPFTPDDSYISFRYADNLASGHGLTFNQGERPVESYSNFLWILLCGFLTRLGLPLPEWAPMAGGALGMASIVLFWQALRRHTTSFWQLALPLSLLASSGPFALYAVSGMETPLYAFLLLAALLCVERILSGRGPKWFLTLSAVSVLAALSRPEGVIVFPVLAACVLYFNRAVAERTSDVRPWRLSVWGGSAFFMISLIVYNIWRARYFGEAVPTPFLSKSGVGFSFMGAWLTNLRFYFVTQNYYFAPFGYYYGLFALVGICTIAAGVQRVPERNLAISSLALATCHMFIYVNFVDWMPGIRYFVPLVGLLFIPLGGWTGSVSIKDSGGSPDSQKRGLILVMCVALTFSSVFSVALICMDARRCEISTRSSLVALGKWLRRCVPGDSLLAISDAGAAPYYSGLKTFDSNPRSLIDGQIAKHGWSKEYFFEKSPDVAIFVSFSLTEPVFFEQHREVVEDNRFSRRYRLIGVTRFDWVKDRCYWVYVKKDLQVDTGQMCDLPRGVQNL
jgi:hypothetical protein